MPFLSNPMMMGSMAAGGGGFDPNTPTGTYVEGEGGYYIGTITYADSRTFALFTPEKAEGQNNSVQWKTTADGTPGTQDDDDGWANLQGMIAAGISSHPMGQFCTNITAGGKDDWYPPAINELYVMYDARGSIAGADAIDTDSDWCWSSTERPDRVFTAWITRFSDGIGNASNNKASPLRVRAVRRLAI